MTPVLHSDVKQRRTANIWTCRRNGSFVTSLDFSMTESKYNIMIRKLYHILLKGALCLSIKALRGGWRWVPDTDKIRALYSEYKIRALYSEFTVCVGHFLSLSLGSQSSSPHLLVLFRAQEASPNGLHQAPLCSYVCLICFTGCRTEKIDVDFFFSFDLTSTI